jgi:ATP-dependent Clp protease ATP-binding subunit ClpB
VDFKNAVIVMTSNMGSQRIQELSGQGYEVMKAAVMDVVGQHFRPEFINRVDDMVVFHPLDREQIKLIAGIQLGSLRKRLESHGFHLDVTEAALSLLGEAGFDPVYGARPLKRAIQQEIENPLAQKILSGVYAAGDTIRVDVTEGRFTFT